MKQYFKTRPDKYSREVYALEIDHDAKTYSDNVSPAPDAITINWAARLRMIGELRDSDYAYKISIT